MPPKRPPDRDEDISNAPPQKNPSPNRSVQIEDQMMNELTTLAGRPSQTNDALLQNVINMMTIFIDTIKELRQEIRELKASRSTQQTPAPTTITHPLPARPHAWNNPYPKQTQASAPKPPPKNTDINKFKAATLIIHKTPGS